MPNGRWRIIEPTMALFLEAGRHVARTVPAGTIVSVDSESFDHSKLVDVMWGEKKVMMFVQDLQSRSKVEPIE